MSFRTFRDLSRALFLRPSQASSGDLGPCRSGHRSIRRAAASAVAMAEPLELRRMLSATPILRFSGADSANEGADYVLNLSATGAGVSDIDSWTIDWGDEQTESLEPDPVSPTQFSILHEFADDRVAAYDIKVFATMNGGAIVHASVEGEGGGTPMPSGTPDATYGPSGPQDVDGTVIRDVSGIDQVFDSVLQPDGKLLVAGAARGGPSGQYMLIARFDVTGQLDESFATDGILDLQDGENSVVAGVARSIAVLPNGDILVAGSQLRARTSGDFGTYPVVVLARYTAAGERDPSLGTTAEFDAFAPDFFAAAAGDANLRPTPGVFYLGEMVVQPDGGVLLGGTANLANGSHFAVGRLKPALGGGGEPTGALVVDANFGARRTDVVSTGIALARFNDATAGAGTRPGEHVLAHNGIAITLGKRPGEIFLSGELSFGGEDPADPGVQMLPRSTTAVVRFHTAGGVGGQLDTRFGQGGLAQAEAPGNRSAAFDVRVDAAGRVVVLSDLSDDPGGMRPNRVALHRFDVQGKLDPTFDGDGQAIPDFGSALAGRSLGLGLLIQGDGKIVVAGSVSGASAFDNTLAVSRYNDDGSFDTSFDSDGLFLGTPGGAGTSINQQADGKLIVAGATFLYPQGTGDIVVTRFGVTTGGGGGGTPRDSLPVRVDNVRPTLALTAPSSGVRQETLSFSGVVTDPGADGWTANIDFGDGTEQTLRGLNGEPFLATHTYGAVGDYPVSVTLAESDADGGAVGVVVEQPFPVTIEAAQFRADPLDSTKTVFAYGAPDGANTISVGQTNGQLTVTEGGQLVGTYSPTGRIRLFAGAGDDVIVVSGGVTRLAEIYGGDGNDVIDGGNGGNIIVGGDGADAITAGSGRDLLIGGRGADVLIGNPGDDVLVSGYTAYDAQPVGLAAIYREWARADQTYAQRVATLSGTATTDLPYRLHNNASALGGRTVFDDSEGDTFSLDLLNGGSGNDWYFANVIAGSAGEGDVRDRIVGNNRGETRSDMDPAA